VMEGKRGVRAGVGAVGEVQRCPPSRV